MVELNIINNPLKVRYLTWYGVIYLVPSFIVANDVQPTAFTVYLKCFIQEVVLQKVIFIIHFILSTWALQGDWCPDSYFFYSLLFFIALFWAIKDKESSDATEMALMLNVLCIALDIVILIIYFPSSSRASGEKFSSGMAVLNLLVRPVTAIALYRLHGDRSGNTNAFPGFGGIFGNSGRTRTVYEDIDSGTHQAVPSNNAAGTSTIPSLYSAQGTEKIPPPYGA